MFELGMEIAAAIWITARRGIKSAIRACLTDPLSEERARIQLWWLTGRRSR